MHFRVFWSDSNISIHFWNCKEKWYTVCVDLTILSGVIALRSFLWYHPLPPFCDVITENICLSQTELLLSLCCPAFMVLGAVVAEIMILDRHTYRKTDRHTNVWHGKKWALVLSLIRKTIPCNWHTNLVTHPNTKRARQCLNSPMNRQSPHQYANYQRQIKVII